MSAKSYRSLTSHQRALVAMAVLLDGNEAANFLGLDASMGERYRLAAEELTRDELEIRLPFIGTLYREALADMSREDND
jgi:hypothetical protein